MSKSLKNIYVTFFIGCGVYVLGTYLSQGFHYETFNEFLIEFGIYQLYTFLLGYSNFYYFDYLESLQWTKEERFKRIAIGILGSTVVSMIGLFILNGIQFAVYEGFDLSRFIQNQHWQNYSFGLWITLTIVITFHFVFFYNKYQQNKVKEQKVIAGSANARFDALKNQLDPHFLFNSLNVLTSLIEENPVNAQKFTTALSKVYRYVLEQKNKDLIPVDEELDFARTYMSLLKMRFEDSIIFDIPLKAKNPECKVVPLSLQLLLENAVKHNMVTTTKPLHIRIYEADGMLIVENNLQTKQMVKKSSGVGLENIKQRYELLTSKKVNINQDATRFTVAIPMLTKQVSTREIQKYSNQETLYYEAKKHIANIKEFYGNLISYVIVIPFLIFINYKTSWDFQWFWFPLLGWGMGLIFHAFRVFGYGKSWEERKIREIMTKDEQTNTWN